MKGTIRRIMLLFPYLSKAVPASFIAYCVDFGILAFLTEVFGIHYQISACVGFYVGTNITYILSVTWIFPYRAIRRKMVEYFLFFAVGTIGVGLNSLILWFFTETVGIHYLVSKIISGSTVFFWNFYARKYILFQKRKS